MLRPTFFSSWFILTILNSCSESTSIATWLIGCVDSFGNVAEALDSFGDLNKSSKLRRAQNLALDYVADRCWAKNVSQTSG